MSNIFKVKTSGGETVLPTADATLYTDLMSADYSSAQVYAEFFSDAAGLVPATPSAGTIAVAGTPMGNCYLPASAGATITASQVGAVTGSYSPSVFSGCVLKGRITFASIADAPYARITFVRA